MSTESQPKYKSPVFAVFPFEQPDVFQYVKPDLVNCDSALQTSIKQLQDDKAKGLTVKKRFKKTKSSKKLKTKKEKKEKD